MGYTNKELQSEYTRNHYADNKEEYLWGQSLRRKLSPKKHKEKRRQYYLEHKEQELKNKQNWRIKNKEAYKLQNKRGWEKRKYFENWVRRFKRLLDKNDYI